MRRALVSLARTENDGSHAGFQDVHGYACEIEGIEFVVHRSLERDPADGSWVLSTEDWTVTEPRTGMSIWDGSATWDKPEKSYTREFAIHRAECFLAERGGVEAVEKQVAKRLNELAAQPSTEKDEAQHHKGEE